MKKIIPFKKDISFDTNIGEIISISLDHEIKSISNNTITGNFTISGDYKITETSLNIDSFEHNLPFDISIDDRYETKDITIDIDNFYYEVTNNRTLEVNIDLAVSNLEEKATILEGKKDIEENLKEEIKLEPKEENRERCVEPETLFNDTEKESYKTYKIYVVKEMDTIESIMEKYEITKEKLEMYNDLNAIKPGDKLIIPSV